MIASLLAAAVLNGQTPPGVRAVAVRTVERCRTVASGGEAPAAGTEWIETAEGLQAEVVMARRNCGLDVDDFTGADDALAEAVRDALGQGWTAETWRARQVSEFGPTVWTTLKGPEGHWVRIIEPAEGARGPLNIAYGVAP